MNVSKVFFDHIVTTCCSSGTRSWLHTVSVSIIAFFLFFMTMQSIQWLPPAWQLRAPTLIYNNLSLCSLFSAWVWAMATCFDKRDKMFALYPKRYLLEVLSTSDLFLSMWVNVRGKSRSVVLSFSSLTCMFRRVLFLRLNFCHWLSC